MAEHPKYQENDTIQFLNANEKPPNNLGKIVGIEIREPLARDLYEIIFTHSNSYPITRHRFPIVDIDNQTELVTELPAGADCPAGGPKGKTVRRGGKT